MQSREFFEGMGLDNEQLEEIKRLSTYIYNHVPEAVEHKQYIDEFDKEENDIIFATIGRGIYEKMLDIQDSHSLDNEGSFLAKIMLGKTIASVENIFPVTTHSAWTPNSTYHRVSHLDGQLIREARDIFNSKQDHSYPVTLVNNFSVNTFLNDYLTEQERNSLTIFTQNELGMIEASKNHHDSFEFDYESALFEKFQSVGLIASPWEIAIFNEQHHKVAPLQTNSKDNIILEQILLKLPTTLSELKKCSAFDALSQIMNDKKNPNNILAQCIYNMISALPEEWDNKDSVQRIALFLNSGVKFNQYDYKKFSFIVHAITHEISLLIHHAMKNDLEMHEITDYSQFKKVMERDAISSFQLASNETEKYKTIAAPAMSGSHAFMIAMDLAKKMSMANGQIPVIKTIGAQYYEFNKFIADMPEGAPNIFSLTVGPIVNPTATSPGIIISKFIEKLRNENQQWPITILADVTTGLYASLEIDDETRKLIEEGKLSIICYESYQKFGLLHTDQVQAGVVYGVSRKSASNENLLQKFEENAALDLKSHLDMIVAAYIHKHCGPLMELIKQQHFENGRFFNEFFKDRIMPIASFDNTIENLDQLYFMCANLKDTNINNQGFRDALHKNIKERHSFGHFETTVCPVVDVMRISPGASDITDTIMEIMQISLLSKYTKDELFFLLTPFLYKLSFEDKPLANEHKILLTSLLITLTRLMTERYPDVESDIAFLKTSIDQFLPADKISMPSRSAIQALHQFSSDHSNIINKFGDMTSNEALLLISARYGNTQMVKLLMRQEIAAEIIMKGAAYSGEFGHTDILKLFIQSGLDPDTVHKTDTNESLLKLAVTNKHIETANEILGNSGHINHLNSFQMDELIRYLKHIKTNGLPEEYEKIVIQHAKNAEVISECLIILNNYSLLDTYGKEILSNLNSTLISRLITEVNKQGNEESLLKLATLYKHIDAAKELLGDSGKLQNLRSSSIEELEELEFSLNKLKKNDIPEKYTKMLLQHTKNAELFLDCLLTLKNNLLLEKYGEYILNSPNATLISYLILDLHRQNKLSYVIENDMLDFYIKHTEIPGLHILLEIEVKQGHIMNNFRDAIMENPGYAEPLLQCLSKFIDRQLPTGRLIKSYLQDPNLAVLIGNFLVNSPSNPVVDPILLDFLINNRKLVNTRDSKNHNLNIIDALTILQKNKLLTINTLDTLSRQAPADMVSCSLALVKFKKMLRNRIKKLEALKAENSHSIFTSNSLFSSLKELYKSDNEELKLATQLLEMIGRKNIIYIKFDGLNESDNTEAKFKTIVNLLKKDVHMHTFLTKNKTTILTLLEQNDQLSLNNQQHQSI